MPSAARWAQGSRSPFAHRAALSLVRLFQARISGAGEKVVGRVEAGHRVGMRRRFAHVHWVVVQRAHIDQLASDAITEGIGRDLLAREDVHVLAQPHHHGAKGARVHVVGGEGAVGANAVHVPIRGVVRHDRPRSVLERGAFEHVLIEPDAHHRIAGGAAMHPYATDFALGAAIVRERDVPRVVEREGVRLEYSVLVNAKQSRTCVSVGGLSDSKRIRRAVARDSLSLDDWLHVHLLLTLKLALNAPTSAPPLTVKPTEFEYELVVVSLVVVL